MLSELNHYSPLTMILVRAYALCFLSYWTTTAAALGVRSQQMKWIQNVTKGKNTEELLDVIERASRHGFTASEHTVETEDGYVLTLFRVQRAGAGVRDTPVLLVHGLLQSAVMWLDAGPGAGLAYLLADEGHDVWLANVRGSHYSRRHAWLNPDTDAQYWQFSIDDIGRHDLPATIDYILSQTGGQKLNYIGFSQGGGAFFVMCSERPEYQIKVNVMIALAPAVRILGTKSVLLRTIFEYYKEKENELSNHGIWEVLPKGGFIQSFSQTFCAFSDWANKVCEIIKDVLDSQNPGSIASSTFPIVLAGFPAGTSVHNMAKYGQSIKSKYFQKFDYGQEQNLVRYGSVTPPMYNLSAVTVPTVVMYGINDGLVDVKDMKWLIKKLPNVIESFVVKDPLWTHFDFSYSRNVPKLILPKIEEYLNIRLQK